MATGKLYFNQEFLKVDVWSWFIDSAWDENWIYFLGG